MRNIWKYLTQPTFRAERRLSHPIVLLWNIIWIIPLLVTLFLFVLVVLFAAGPRMALRVLHEHF